MTNNDYLELRDKTMLSVAYFPFMFWLYNIIYEPIMLVWMFLSLCYVAIAAFVMAVKSLRYELWEDADHPM